MKAAFNLLIPIALFFFFINQSCIGQETSSFTYQIKISPSSPKDLVSDSCIKTTINFIIKRFEAIGCIDVSCNKTDSSKIFTLGGKVIIAKKPRLKPLIETIGNIEFQETINFMDIIGYFTQANNYLAKQLEINSSLKSEVTGYLKKHNDQKEIYTEFGLKSPLFSNLSLNLIRNDKGQYSVGEGPLCGYTQVKDTAWVTKLLDRCFVIFPSNLKFMWTYKPLQEEENQLQLIAIKTYSDADHRRITNKAIENLTGNQDWKGKPTISLTMNNEASIIWAKMTEENIGNSIAIVLDNHVFAYPKIQEVIQNGDCTITGNFSQAEAQDLISMIKNGPLPAKVTVFNETRN